MEKAEFSIIAGTGLEKLKRDAEYFSVKTPYGYASPLFMGNIGKKRVVFLPRHGPKHSMPPHAINYRANVYALHRIGVERILATNAVGAIGHDVKPGYLIVPHDFVDFTKLRCSTFYDKAPVTHVDVSQPYCPEIRKLLIENARRNDLQVCDKAVLACTEGPRFETSAEIEMFRRLGCDAVGMTSFPEVVLARELEMCYACICYVSNKAAGMQERLTALEVSKISKQIFPKMEKVLIDTIKSLPSERIGTCPCASALQNARFA